MKRLILIDGHAILYRAYYAFPKTLKTRNGELVNAVYGFTRMLLGVIHDLKPACLAVVFDLPEPTFRHHEFIGYQAQRPKADEAMVNQIERVLQVVRTMNLPVYTAKGFEADDVIGTLALQAVPMKLKSKRKKGKSASKKLNLEVIIVTGDKDIMQLIRPGVKVYAPVKGFSQAELYDAKKVKALLGVSPGQIVDYKALVGDSSDNYPGVPGIGPKTAVDLLSRFQTLAGIYRHLDEIKPAVASKLKQDKPSALLSRKLAEIVDDAPVKLNLKACRIHDYDIDKVRHLFEELEFRSLVGKLPGAKRPSLSQPQKQKEKKSSEQMKLI